MANGQDILNQLNNVVPMWICPVTKVQIPASEVAAIQKHIDQVVFEKAEKARLLELRAQRKAYYAKHFAGKDKSAFMFNLRDNEKLGDCIKATFDAFGSPVKFKLTTPELLPSQHTRSRNSFGLLQVFVEDGSMELMTEVIKAIGFNTLNKTETKQWVSWQARVITISVPKCYYEDLHSGYKAWQASIIDENYGVSRGASFKKLSAHIRESLLQSPEYRALVSQREEAITKLREARDAVHLIDAKMEEARTKTAKSSRTIRTTW